jgi:hypothetical protein
MKQLFVTLAAMMLAVSSTEFVQAATVFSSDVSTWTSGSPAGAGLYPIGGAGQVNGNFVVTTESGIEIGIRASHRFVQNVDPLGNTDDGTQGIYYAPIGTSPPPAGAATWNYDIHIDLRNATGLAAGTNISDYTVILTTDIFGGILTPIDITSLIPADAVLFQTSQNPIFGNPTFNAFAAKTYTFQLDLVPNFDLGSLSADMLVITPEPGSMVLLGMGAFGMIGVAYRRRRNAKA